MAVAFSGKVVTCKLIRYLVIFDIEPQKFILFSKDTPLFWFFLYTCYIISDLSIPLSPLLSCSPPKYRSSGHQVNQASPSSFVKC